MLLRNSDVTPADEVSVKALHSRSAEKKNIYSSFNYEIHRTSSGP